MNRIVYKGLIYDRNGLRKSTVIIEDGIIARIYDGIVNISGEIVLDYSNYNSIVCIMVYKVCISSRPLWKINFRDT